MIHILIALASVMALAAVLAFIGVILADNAPRILAALGIDASAFGAPAGTAQSVHRQLHTSRLDLCIAPPS
jgi:hypothetical protein